MIEVPTMYSEDDVKCMVFAENIDDKNQWNAAYGLGNISLNGDEHALYQRALLLRRMGLQIRSCPRQSTRDDEDTVTQWIPSERRVSEISYNPLTLCLRWLVQGEQR